MNEIIVKTQKDFDGIEQDFKGYIKIIGGTYEAGLTITARPNAIMSVSDSAVIKSVYGSAVIEYVYGSAVIKSVYDSAVIKSVYDSAVIESVSDSAVIKSVYDSAVIKSVYDSAVIESVSDSAVIKSVYGSAVIKYVYGSAVIKSVYGFASILMVSMRASVSTFGFNIVRYFSTSLEIKLDLSKNTTVIKLDNKLKQPTSIEDFCLLYPVEIKEDRVIMYKAVHKNKDGVYFSDYKNDFIYEIGKVKTEKVSEEDISCSGGIHISHKMFAIQFGRSWNDMALLECEADIKDIKVSPDTDGKVRASKIKIIREVPKEEY